MPKTNHNSKGAGRSAKPDAPVSESLRNHLLIIGIDAYKNFARLDNAVRDARALETLLTESYLFDQVDAFYDDAASYDRIEAYLSSARKQLTESDTLLIFFSGHGYYRSELEMGYLLPVDAQQRSMANTIATPLLERYLKHIKARHVFIVLDCCYGGALQLEKSRMANRADISHRVARCLGPSSRWMLSAGAIEEVSDGLTGRHSPFMEAFLEVMSSNVHDHLPVSELVYQVEKNVLTRGVKQFPVGGPMSIQSNLEGEYVFFLRKNEERCWAEAQLEDTVNGYEKYLHQFQPAKYDIEANDRIDQLSFENAEKAGQIESYLGYLKRFRIGGKFIFQAFDAISQLSIKANEEYRAVSRLAIRLEQQVTQLKSSNDTKTNSYQADLTSWKTTAARHEQTIAKLEGALEQALEKQKVLENQFKKSEKNANDFQKRLEWLQNERDTLYGELHKLKPLSPRQIKIDLVKVEGGVFRNKSKTAPVETIKDFYLSACPVTFEQFDAFRESRGLPGPKDNGSKRGKYPVVNVSWADALHFCNWMSKMENLEPAYQFKGEAISWIAASKGYRLPSEKEWEYAARGGKYAQAFHYSGSNQLEEVGWFTGNTKQLRETGLKKPNALGLYDMSGNVWEWCWDRKPGDIGVDKRVVKGGGWREQAEICRINMRVAEDAQTCSEEVGFRVARTI